MKIPNINSRVRVVMRNPFGPAQIPPAPSTVVYQGQVIAPDRWMTPYQFNVTGDERYPVRTLDSRFVDSIEILEGSANDIDTEIQTWQIKGSRGNRYTVTKNASGFTCTCPGFQFRKNCRHLAEVSAH